VKKTGLAPGQIGTDPANAFGYAYDMYSDMYPPLLQPTTSIRLTSIG